MDEQTLRGKAPACVAPSARAAGVPVVVACGRSSLAPDVLGAAGISVAYSCAELEPDPGRSMAEAAAQLGGSVVASRAITSATLGMVPRWPHMAPARCGMVGWPCVPVRPVTAGTAQRGEVAVTQPASKTVTSKVLAILRAFDCPESTLTLTRIADVAGLTMPTAHRLVGELVEGGALKKDGRGRYRVGRLIGKVGDNAGPEMRASGRAHLVEVIRQTGEACHFAIRDGDQAMIRDRLYGPEQAHRAKMVGDRLPLHLTAVGLALLAFDAEPEREAYLAHEVDGTPRFTAPERRRLARELEKVRERRYAILMSEPHSGPASVAVPVLLGADYAVAALGLIMTTTHPRQLVRRTAALLDVARRMEPEARRWVHFNAVREALERGL